MHICVSHSKVNSEPLERILCGLQYYLELFVVGNTDMFEVLYGDCGSLRNAETRRNPSHVCLYKPAEVHPAEGVGKK